MWPHRCCDRSGDEFASIQFPFNRFSIIFDCKIENLDRCEMKTMLVTAHDRGAHTRQRWKKERE